MSEELKPCAYCGGEGWLREWGSGWALTCRHNRTLARFADFTTEKECDIAIVLTPTKAEAITAWNTRPGEQAAYEAGVQAGRAAERERIVGRLNARKQTAAISETRANQNNKPHIALVYHNEVEVWDEAIAIAREEGGG